MFLFIIFFLLNFIPLQCGAKGSTITDSKKRSVATSKSKSCSTYSNIKTTNLNKKNPLPSNNGKKSTIQGFDDLKKKCSNIVGPINNDNGGSVLGKNIQKPDVNFMESENVNTKRVENAKPNTFYKLVDVPKNAFDCPDKTTKNEIKSYTMR